MKISNKTYDRMKWFALIFIPAFETLILTVGKIWSIPYYLEIGATIAAIGLFLGSLLGGHPTMSACESETNNVDCKFMLCLLSDSL